VAARCRPAPTANTMCTMASGIRVWDPKSSIHFSESVVISLLISHFLHGLDDAR
jgi:hypothetical protein